MLLWRITELIDGSWLPLTGDPTPNYAGLERRYRWLKEDYPQRKFRVEFQRIPEWQEYH